MLAVRSPARETLRRGAHSRRQIKDGNGSVIRLGASAPMVKRLLTGPPIHWARVLASARHWPRYGQFRRHAAGVRAALDTLEPIPSTTLLSAQEAKDRLREIVEGFFFWRLRTEMENSSGACSSRAPGWAKRGGAKRVDWTAFGLQSFVPRAASSPA